MRNVSAYGVLSVAVIAGMCSAQAAGAASAGTLWPSDCLTKVMRADTPGPNAATALAVSGARGEIVSGQAVFRTPTDLAGATVSITDLRHRKSGATIPAGAIKLQWVRYIDVTRNSSGVPKDELVAAAPTAIPDPYWEDPTIPVAAGQSQPVWIEVRVPRNASPGDYDAALTVTGGAKPVGLPVTVHIWGFDVPEQRHLSVINWWRFPGPGFDSRVKGYSDEYWSLLASFCAFLVDHRQTDVNASLGGLIQEKGSEQDGYTYDTSRLERYADVAFEAGIRQIHLHSVGRRTAHILDPASRIEPQAPSIRRLAALEGAIQRRGWKKRFAVSISDEPFLHHEESYAAVVDLVHKTAPSVRCVEAVEAEYLGKLDICVPKLSHLNLWYPRFDRIRREGAELWFYTCCHPAGRYPNRFLDQSLLKARVLHWINYLYDLDGYLHWGLNHFHGDAPYTQEGISHGLPLGDRAIAYPGREGLLGSLRFSALRDGLQDFEYLWVLEDRLEQLKRRVGKDAFWLDPRQRPLELCRRVVWSFHDYTRDPRVMLETRRAIAEEIEALHAEPVLYVQTSSLEGAVIPAGPRHLSIRGLATPGAEVTVNGKPVKNVRPSGYFSQVHFMPDDKPTVTIVAKQNGKEQTGTRTFKLTD